MLQTDRRIFDTVYGCVCVFFSSQNFLPPYSLRRGINGCKIYNKIKTKVLLNRSNTLSINQLNAQIKLTEMQKANHFDNYPLNLIQQSCREVAIVTRTCKSGGHVEVGSKPFVSDPKVSYVYTLIISLLLN